MSHYHTSADGTRVHYTQCGNPSERTVVLLHGLGGSTETFTPLLQYLQPERYNLISIDFEGFGKTSLNLEQSSISVGRHVANLGDVISHVQGSEGAHRSAPPIIIIGHSLGSVVALHYTAQHPDTVAGLGLLGVGRSAAHIPAACERMLGLAAKTRSEGIAYAADLAMTTNFPPDASDVVRNEVRQAVAASDPEGYARTCEAMVRADHEDPDYSKITCPAVFVAGRDDMISPPARADEVSRLLGGQTTVVLVAGGHQPILSDPDATREAMRQLLDLVEA